MGDRIRGARGMPRVGAFLKRVATRTPGPRRRRSAFHPLQAAATSAYLQAAGDIRGVSRRLPRHRRHAPGNRLHLGLALLHPPQPRLERVFDGVVHARRRRSALTRRPLNRRHRLQARDRREGEPHAAEERQPNGHEERLPGPETDEVGVAPEAIEGRSQQSTPGARAPAAEGGARDT